MDGVEAGDVVQGALADCWILSALSIIACNPDLLYNLFVSDEYADQGIYVVQVFKNGEWVPVMVDDRIPVDIISSRPLFARCGDPNEIWLLILEKAYAKVHGCYEALSGGQTDYALRDFTGGIPMQFNLAGNQSEGHWTRMTNKITAGHQVLLGTACVNASASIEAELGLGILQNHAYSILQMSQDVGQKLFKLRNPWGKGEWSGKYSDKWIRDNGSEALKEQLKYVDADDGMFWMCYDDLQMYFTHIYLCDVAPSTWQSFRIAGRWDGESCGGCMNNKASWFKNPCYAFTVETTTDVVITLSQPDVRMQRDPEWFKSQLSIGLVVYKTKSGRPKQRLKKKDLLTGQTLGFSMDREVVCDSEEAWEKDRETHDGKTNKLKEGDKWTYFVVPSTFHAQVEGKFTLSVNSSGPVTFLGNVSPTADSADSTVVDGEHVGDLADPVAKDFMEPDGLNTSLQQVKKKQEASEGKRRAANKYEKDAKIEKTAVDLSQVKVGKVKKPKVTS